MAVNRKKKKTRQNVEHKKKHVQGLFMSAHQNLTNFLWLQEHGQETFPVILLYVLHEVCGTYCIRSHRLL